MKPLRVLGLAVGIMSVIAPVQAGIFDVIKEGAKREARKAAVDAASEATGVNMSCAAYTGRVDVMRRCMEYSLGNAITRDFGTMLRGGDVNSQQSAVMSTLFTGEPQSWTSNETGASGEASVVKEKTRTRKKSIVVLQDQVETVPDLDLVGENYRANAGTNVRSGPATTYKIVGKLRSGDVVNVVGRVSGGEWYLISQGGVATGYVFAELLDDAATQEATVVGAPEGEPVEVKTKTTQTCRTIEQTVRAQDGSTKTKKVKACQSPNGWEIV